MKRFYSVLHLVDPEDSKDEGVYVVCETLNDEREVTESAQNQGLYVTNAIAAENTGRGLFLNDFTT